MPKYLLQTDPVLMCLRTFDRLKIDDEKNVYQFLSDLELPPRCNVVNFINVLFDRRDNRAKTSRNGPFKPMSKNLELTDKLRKFINVGYGCPFSENDYRRKTIHVCAYCRHVNFIPIFQEPIPVTNHLVVCDTNVFLTVRDNNSKKIALYSVLYNSGLDIFIKEECCFVERYDLLEEYLFDALMNRHIEPFSIFFLYGGTIVRKVIELEARNKNDDIVNRQQTSSSSFLNKDILTTFKRYSASHTDRESRPNYLSLNNNWDDVSLDEKKTINKVGSGDTVITANAVKCFPMGQKCVLKTILNKCFTYLCPHLTFDDEQSLTHLSKKCSPIPHVSEFILKRISKYVGRMGIQDFFDRIELDSLSVYGGGGNYQKILETQHVYLALNVRFEYNVLYRCVTSKMHGNDGIDEASLEYCKTMFKHVFDGRFEEYKSKYCRNFPDTWYAATKEKNPKNLESIIKSKIIYYFLCRTIVHDGNEITRLYDEHDNTVDICTECWTNSCDLVEDNVVFVDIDNIYFLLHKSPSPKMKSQLISMVLDNVGGGNNHHYRHHNNDKDKGKRAIAFSPLLKFSKDSNVYRFFVNNFTFTHTPFDDGVTYLNYKLIYNEDYSLENLQTLLNLATLLKYSSVYKLDFAPNQNAVLRQHDWKEIHPWELTYSNTHV